MTIPRCNTTQALATLMMAYGSLALGQVDNLRISEVDPAADTVEITNIGGAFTTGASHPFCHRFDYASSIASGTTFDVDEARLFQATGLNDGSSDLWLYRQAPFSTAANIVSGLQYGAGGLGRSGLASGVGLWSGADSFAPTPAAGNTLAWDGFGDTAFDWYEDETPSLGFADSTLPGVVPAAQRYPAGTQDWEAVLLGDDLTAVEQWPIVDSSPAGAFTVRAVRDVLGVTGPRGESTRWMRIHDQDPDDVQNRFYGPTIAAPAVDSYVWSFWVNPERLPPEDSDNYPRFTIQHANGGFANAWGIEYRSDGAYLVVIGVGGDPAEAFLYGTELGEWAQVDLTIDFQTNTLSASVDINPGPPVQLPIDLDVSADPNAFRFCYRGEGTGNVGTFLMDDVSVLVNAPDELFEDDFELLLPE